MELWQFKFPTWEQEKNTVWQFYSKDELAEVGGPRIALVHHWFGNAPVVMVSPNEIDHIGVRFEGCADREKSVWDTQVGGNHYTKMKIQPFQFSMANKLDPMQHTIIKYVTRFRDKNGIQDLEKAKQTIDLLIAYEKEQ